MPQAASFQYSLKIQRETVSMMIHAAELIIYDSQFLYLNLTGNIPQHT